MFFCRIGFSQERRGRSQSHSQLFDDVTGVAGVSRILLTEQSSGPQSTVIVWRLYTRKVIINSGASPIKILQRKFYATLIFKHPDWFENLSSQSECLKNCVAYNLRCKIFIGSVPSLCLTAPGCTTSSHRPPAWAWATSANTPSASKVGGRFSENRFTEFDET